MTLTKANFLLLLSLLLAPLAVSALSSDQEQPIHIEADRLELDESKHISTYTGSVSMQQGSLDIRADTIVIHFDKDNNLQWMDIHGKPASFKQLTDKQETVNGSALNIVYREAENMMELKGKGRFSSGEDLIESEFIQTNTRTNALMAGAVQGKGRVRMLIKPKTP